MNESTLRTMLADRTERVEVGPAPLDDARRAGQHMRRRRSILAASIGTVGVVVAATIAALVIRPGSDTSSEPTDSLSPTLDSRWQGTMSLSPSTAQPGATVSMFFPRSSTFGLAYTLAPWTGEEWADVEYYLSSDGGGGFKMAWWRPDDGSEGWPSIGFHGPGPDHVTIPPVASDGSYLLCTFQRDSCDVVTVRSNETSATTIAVPNVLGMTVEEATLTLQDSGLTVDVVQGTNPCPDGRTCDYVGRMNPAPGTSVDSGTSVSILIVPRPTDTGGAPDLTLNEFPDASDIQGTWDVTIAGNVKNGHQLVDTYQGIDLSMTFDSNSLTFNDGCDDYAGTFTLVHQDFAVTTTPLTTRRCLAGTSTPLDDLVNQARHATIADGHLYLHADSFQILLSLTPETAHGSLSTSEYTLAVATAKQFQRTVTGTFIGATAVVAQGTQRCSLRIRLVWKKDANFVHSHVFGAPPDGPRKAALLTVDPQTGDVCGTGAKYRDVGAAPDETLLYGRWPG